MTQETQTLALFRSSARDFLYCKPDSHRPPSAAVFPDPQFCGRIEGFPDLLVGAAFVTRASALLEPLDAFATVVLGIDAGAPPSGEPEEDGDPPRPGPFHAVLAARLQETSAASEGLWGWLAFDRFGWILPDADAARALEAVERLQAALADDHPETVSAGIAVHPCLQISKSQMIENARKALDHAAFFGPGSTAVFDDVTLNISGDQRYQHGDINGAMEEFKKALALNPDNTNVHNSLGVCYGVLGAYETALRCFEATLERVPGDVMALYNAGMAHLMIGDRDRALTYLLTAHGVAEPIFEVNFQTGRLYMARDQAAKARPYLEGATRLRPDSAAAWRLLGECLFALDDVAAAVDAYKRSVKLNPGDAEALSALGCLFDRQGENPEITTIFCEQAVDIAPENGLFHHRLGTLYLKQERHDDALRAFRRAAALGHDSAAQIARISAMGLLPEGSGDR